MSQVAQPAGFWGWTTRRRIVSFRRDMARADGLGRAHGEFEGGDYGEIVVPIDGGRQVVAVWKVLGLVGAAVWLSTVSPVTLPDVVVAAAYALVAQLGRRATGGRWVPG